MSVFLDPVTRQTKPGSIAIEIPANYKGLGKRLEGTLRMSSKGYVYQIQSEATLRFKFLQLGCYLPYLAVMRKIGEFAQTLFDDQKFKVQEKHHAFNHLGNLFTISLKAVFGMEDVSIYERQEEFALAEMAYNEDGCNNEIDKVRSVRLLTGTYLATCMQPLFHKDQVKSAISIDSKRKCAMNEKADLESAAEINHELKVLESSWGISRLIYYVRSQWNPNCKLSNDEISKQLEVQDNLLKSLEEQQECAERCDKYACRAILDQQGCCDVKAEFKKRFVEEHEVKCCNTRVCLTQRICGCFYNIDFCGLSCYALDCVCCFCCIFPRGRSCCLVI